MAKTGVAVNAFPEQKGRGLLKMFVSSQMLGGTQGSVVMSTLDEKDPCLPVTIRSIEEALLERAESQGEVQFYGREQSMLVLVASVDKVEKSGAVVEVSLNDASGVIKGWYFMTDENGKWAESVTCGSYVNVVGHVSVSPEVHFTIHMLHPVKSADDVSFHLIEVAHAALKLQNVKGRSHEEPITPMKPVEVSKTMSGSVAISPPKMASTGGA